MTDHTSRSQGVASENADAKEAQGAPRRALLRKTGLVAGLALIGGRFVARTPDGTIATTATTAGISANVAGTGVADVKTIDRPGSQE